MIRVDQKSIRKLSKKLEKEARKMGDSKIKRKIMVKAAQPIRQIAKDKVPVDLGILKKAIKVLREKKSVPGTYIGPKVSGRVLRESNRPSNLPLMIEYGTVHQRPQPYMRPAAAQGIPKAKSIIEREYKKLADST